MTVLCPGSEAPRIARPRFAKGLAADQFVTQGIGLSLGRAAGWPGRRRFLLAGHLDRGRGDRDRDDHDVVRTVLDATVEVMLAVV